MITGLRRSLLPRQWRKIPLARRSHQSSSRGHHGPEGRAVRRLRRKLGERWALARIAWIGLLVVLQAACATLEGSEYGVFDGNEGFNRKSYEFSDVIDKQALVPVARGYQHIAPDLVETGISNFFANLRSLDSSANGFLQGKPKRGATDSLRFVINSTIGLGGLFDVATPAGLHHQDEDFGQTLAVWGWKKSRYIYVPLFGPSTVRDLPTLVVSGLLPRLVLGSVHNLGITSLGVVSARAGALALTDTRDASALDAYVFTREAYVQHRKFLIFDGDPPVEEFDDFFDEFDADE